MKQYILILVLMLSTLIGANAQDVIAHRDGNVTMGKVVEISKDVVKYRKMDNLEGPLYTLQVSDLLSIRFENGTQEVFGQKPAAQKQTSVSTPDDDEEESDDANFSYKFRPEIRLRMDAPGTDIVDAGGGVMAVAGVQVNRCLILGPGIGLLGHSYCQDDLSSFEFPVFLQTRLLVPTKGISPYFIGQGGYSFGKLHDDGDILKDGYTHRLGFFYSVGLGFRMKLKRGSLFMDMTWNTQQWRNVHGLDTPRSICISGGYFFERRK